MSNANAGTVVLTKASDRELVITRDFNAPLELVWKAWAEPERLMRWWGQPKGSTAPVFKIDFRVGGAYLCCIRSPLGRDYWFGGVHREIVPLQRIVYTHRFADEKGNPVPAAHYGMSGEWPEEWLVTVSFKEHDGRTTMTVRQVGLPAGEMGEATKLGWNESLDKLAESLKTSSAAQPDEELVMTRVFNAPRELVWKAWTEPDRLKHWWGPKGFTWVSGTMDFRPNGIFHYGMRSPSGQEMWGKFEYREIAAPEGLAYIVSFSDKDGKTLRNPGSPTWPLEILNTMKLTEHDGKTTATLRGIPVNATEEERETFAAAHAGVRGGLKGTLDQLDEYLAQAQISRG